MPTASQTRVGIIGLGLMGTAMTERLLQFGYVPRIWNRTAEKAAPLIALGAVSSDNPFAECDRVILSLYSSEVVESVLSERLHSLRPGQIIVDTTTSDPEHSLRISQTLASRGVSYLDAPISGSSEQTRRGEATVLVGGERHAWDACSDLWSVLGKNVFHVGGSGAAARMKLVTNLVLGLNRAALAEGLAFAETLGLNPVATLEVLQASAAYSRQMDTKGSKMIHQDFSVQARLTQHLRDVCLILQLAADKGLSLTLAQTHRELLERAEAMGLGQLDNSAIVQVMRQNLLPPDPCSEKRTS